MPGVLMLESLSQLAAVLLLHREDAKPDARVYLRGVNDAKFRRQVVPGDRLRLEITLGRRRSSLARAQAAAYVGDQIAAEAELLLGLVADGTEIHPTAIVHPRAYIGRGTVVGPHAVIGPHVRVGERCSIGASAVIDGWTEIGDETDVFPFASIGLIPQDLKFKGEMTKLTIGRRNVFREFVTINRGTMGGGGVTETCSWRTCTSPTTATSGMTRSSGRTPHSAATSPSRTSRTSAPGRRCISSAASAATRSSAGTRW